MNWQGTNRFNYRIWKTDGNNIKSYRHIIGPCCFLDIFYAINGLMAAYLWILLRKLNYFQSLMRLSIYYFSFQIFKKSFGRTTDQRSQFIIESASRYNVINEQSHF